MKWKQLLPTITIKAEYMDPKKAPLAKGEGASRADFPKEFKKDEVPILDFKTYLEELRNKDGFNLGKTYKGACRLLGLLEMTPSDLKPDVKIDSPETLVAFFTSGTHLHLLKSPLMSPKYTWPSMIVLGLELYVDYQVRNLAISHSAGDMGKFKNQFPKVVSLQCQGDLLKTCFQKWCPCSFRATC